MRDNRRSFFILLVVIFVISGCAGAVKPLSEPHGRLEPASAGERKMTIEELEKNWRDYSIYYVGISALKPSAVLFDPKDDNHTLVGTRKPWQEGDDRWIDVTKNKEENTEKEVSRVVNAIKGQKFAQFFPGLYRIIGPDDQFYGYLFSAWNRAVIKGNNGTYSVLVRPVPPHLQYIR